jgi:hypothetical protein
LEVRVVQVEFATAHVLGCQPIQKSRRGKDIPITVNGDVRGLEDLLEQPSRRQRA